MIASKDAQSLPTAAALSEPARIVYLIDQLDSLEGGAERSLWLITELLPERYEPIVVTLKQPKDPLCLRSFRCRVLVLPIDRTWDFAAAKAALNLRRLIRGERVEIVQTFFESSDLWGGLVSTLSGGPVLISSRRDMGYRRLRKHEIAYRLLGSMFDRIHTVSEAVREYTIQHDRAAPDRVITIQNGVDMQRLRAALPGDHLPNSDILRLRRQYGIETASHVVVDVTGIRAVKGVDVLMRTAAEVCREFPRALFLVAGPVLEKDYFDHINQLLPSLGIGPNFRFLGPIDPVFPMLRLCNVFCHLSRSDGLSNAILEAMGCGLPCVVSRVGGNPEVVAEGLSGFVVPAESPESAADRIRTLLRYPDCARHMGARGRQIVNDHFTADVMVRKLVELYDRLRCESLLRTVPFPERATV